jgi:glycosyltransferase involved in cell wall biosynthesis
MRVAVIIPCRGHGAFLGEALAGVIGQSTNHDVIPVVVCDADDDAFSICQSVGVRAINLVSHSGVYVALNTGIAECGGYDWVTFCGADDVFDACRIESLLGAPDVTWRSVLNSPHVKIGPTGDHLEASDEALGGVFMYHRQMMERLGGFRPWPCSADTDLYRRAMGAGGKRQIVSESTYFYRQHGNQLTHKGDTGFGSPVRRAFEARMADGVRYINPTTAEVKERTL